MRAHISQLIFPALLLASLPAAAQAPAAAAPPSRAADLARDAAAPADGGRVELALRAASDAERLALARRDYAVRSSVERTRAVVARFTGNNIRGTEHARLAVQHALRSGEGAVLSAAYSQLASSYQQIGDWSRALDNARKAYESHPAPTDRVRALYLVQRGIVLHELREGSEALASFREARTLAQKIGDARLTAFAQMEEGLTLWLIEGRPAEALPYFEESHALAERAGSVTLLPSILTNWGGALRDLKRYAEAIGRFRQGLAIRPGGGPNSAAPVLTKNLGQTLALAGRRREAEATLLEAVELSDRMNSPHPRWQARMELGMLYADRDPAKADRYFAESIEVLEATSSNFALENFRAGAFGHWLNKYDPFDLYMDFLLERGETARAFDVAERARARAFLDMLSSAREHIVSAVPASFTKDENALLAEISSTQAALRRSDLPADQRVARAALIVDLEERLSALRLRFAVDHPALAHARYPRLRTAAEIASTLAPGERMLMFYLGVRQSTAWIVGADGTQVVRLPPRAALTPLVRAYVEMLKSPESKIDAQARALRAALAPALEALPAGGRLVIVPHGVLNSLPFEALPAREGGFLAEDHVVSYAPSASSFAFLREARPSAPAGPAVLAIGDPPAAGDAAERRDAPLRQIAYLKPLVWARQELREISGIFRSQTRVLYGSDATESALARAGVETAAVVHFATHGLLDEAKPERSALALAARPPAEDGILQVREIYRWRLRAALVTLSACETALGRDVTGEGFIGLSRAFFAAGATAVTASLWNVDDRSTALFMRHFYTGLRDGSAIDVAARDARLTMIREGGRFSHPYYWSPFIVTGHAARRIDFAPPAAAAGVQFLTPSIVVAAGMLAVVFRRRG